MIKAANSLCWFLYLMYSVPFKHPSLFFYFKYFAFTHAHADYLTACHLLIRSTNHSHTHTLMAQHQEQLGVQCLAQSHFNVSAAGSEIESGTIGSLDDRSTSEPHALQIANIHKKLITCMDNVSIMTLTVIMESRWLPSSRSRRLLLSAPSLSASASTDSDHCPVTHT